MSSDDEASVLGKRSRDDQDANGESEHKHWQLEDDDDDDIGPMPMPDTMDNGTRKKRKGIFVLCKFGLPPLRLASAASRETLSKPPA